MPRRMRQKSGPQCVIVSRRPLCPPWPPPSFSRATPARQVELVVHDQHLVHRRLDVVHQRADRKPAAIHVGLRLEQHQLAAFDRRPSRSRPGSAHADGTARRAPARARRRTRSPRCDASAGARDRDCPVRRRSATVCQPWVTTLRWKAPWNRKRPGRPGGRPVSRDRTRRLLLGVLGLGVRRRLGAAPAAGAAAHRSRGRNGRTGSRFRRRSLDLFGARVVHRDDRRVAAVGELGNLDAFRQLEVRDSAASGSSARPTGRRRCTPAGPSAGS